MRLNPFLNAFVASGYIGAIVLFLNFLHGQNRPDIAPVDGMGALSLLVFSAAIMGFLFFYRPAVLLIENQKKAALSFFFATVSIFGAISAAIFAFVTLL